MKKCMPIILKIALIVFALLGVGVTIFSGGSFMSTSAFLFFTIQSNITIMLTMIICLIFSIKKIATPQWLKTIKFVFTVAITLTFLVFSIMLTPNMIIQGQTSYLYSISNICLHNLVPIIAIIDWALYDYDFKSNKLTFLYGTIMPLYYLVFAMIASTTTIDFGGGSHFPYFFFDYITNTWFSIGNGKIGTFYWIVLLVGIVIGISYALLAIKNKRAKKIAK